MKQGDKIAVYGTLRPGARNAHLMRGAKHLCEDTITGAVIHNLGWYPGLKLHNTDDMVHVDVFEIEDPKLPNSLDAYEGFPTLYNRVRVLTDEGHDAWLYTYNGPVKESDIVPSGDWNQVQMEA